MAASGKGALRIAIEDFLETFDLPKIYTNWQNKILEHLEDENIKLYTTMVDKFGMTGKLPPELSPANIKLVTKTSQQGFWFSLAAIVAGLMGGIFGATQPFARLYSYYTDKYCVSYRPPPAELYQLSRLNNALKPHINQIMSDLGIETQIARGYELLSQPYIDATSMEILRRKEAITDADFKSELSIHGWTDKRIEQIKALRDLIPAPADLVRMAVRESFNSGVVSKFGYGENYPAEFGEWMKKQGFSTDWAKKFWYAHWELPSLTQGFEMLHRLRSGESHNPVSEADIRTLLQIQDIAPFWRERLMEISYNPLTRVDVRRMFGMGVLSEKEVYQNYRDLGYNDKNAKRMTEFTVRYERQTERGLTREAIQNSYKRGMIKRSNAISQLSDIGFPEDIADFYLDIIDFDLEAANNDEKLDAIKAKYIAGQLNDSTVIDQIGKLNMPAERSTAMLEVWKIQRQNKVAIASRSELDDFYRRGLIDTDDYRADLKLSGYAAKTIDLFTQRIDSIMQEEAVLEAERAQKEAERLRTAKLASKYQKDKAGLDVTIAEARLAIADLKVSLHSLIDETAIDANKLRQKEIQAIIYEIQLEKSELTYSYKSSTTEGTV